MIFSHFRYTPLMPDLARFIPPDSRHRQRTRAISTHLQQRERLTPMLYAMLCRGNSSAPRFCVLPLAAD
jgi:hypothetical protein